MRTAVVPASREEVEQALGRMPVAVLGADADHAHRGVQFGVEPLALVGRPVVRHLHEVDGAEAGRRRASAPGRPRRDRRGTPRDTRARRDRSPRWRRSPARPAASGQTTRQRASPRSPCRPATTSTASAPPRTSGPRTRSERFPSSGPWMTVSTRPTAASTPPTWSASQWVSTSRSILPIPSSRQAALECGGIGAGVDQRGRTGGADEDGVALPDVAGRDIPRAGSRRSGHDRGADAHADRHREAHREERRDHGPRASPHAGRHEEQGQRGAGGEERGARRIGRPRESTARERRSAVRDECDPRRGDPRHLQDRDPDRGQHGEHEAPDQSEDGSHRCRGRGEQVGRHAVERDRGVEQDEDRLAGELRGDRHGEQHGERGRHHHGEALGERAGEEQQPGRGGSRQREAVVASEPRVEGEQSDRRRPTARRRRRPDDPSRWRRAPRRPSRRRARRSAAGSPARRTRAAPGAATATRAPRRRPHSAARANAAAVTIAQFAPETAVRWLSELARIAASSSAPTRVVSPIARPGTSAPPSPPSRRRGVGEAGSQADRPSEPRGRPRDDVRPRPSTASRNALCSAAGSGETRAANPSRLPMASISAGTATVVVTGTARAGATVDARPAARRRGTRARRPHRPTPAHASDGVPTPRRPRRRRPGASPRARRVPTRRGHGGRGRPTTRRARRGRHDDEADRDRSHPHGRRCRLPCAASAR